MFVNKHVKEIHEVVEYIDALYNNQQTKKPDVRTPIVTRLMEHIDNMTGTDSIMGNTAKELLSTTIELSSFDVETGHLSNKLSELASDLSTLSESNLAIVEETTASMNTVVRRQITIGHNSKLNPV